ncbi:MAG: sigma-70 family RNA polymerase sigma factor [Clostridia bacterium]|nr:sigma-70 family RNA polymerase sigma factor [Clostridia bacterium]
MEAVKVPDSYPEEMLEWLIRENEVSLKRFCYFYLHDRTLAEDAVQETFLKAYRSLKNFRGEANERTYLTRIAINTCKDMLRTGWFRHMDRRITPEELPVRQETDPFHREVTAAVMNLPRKLREVTLLYYYQGMTMPEITDILHISQPAVTGRLKRAREQLKKELKGEGIDE